MKIIRLKIMKNLSIVIILILASVSIDPQTVETGIQSINSNKLMITVKTLSSEEFDGRLPGSEGYNKAANFAADKFIQAGLVPAGDKNYFQYLTVEYNRIDTPVVFKAVVSEEVFNYEHGKDFVVRGFSGSGDFTLPVVFCGYGISRPDLGFDDYENVDVKNKIALVFKQNPHWKINDKKWGNENPREKSRIAFEHGAKGILFVSLPNDEKSQELIGSVLHGEGEQLENFPQLHISLKTANDFLSTTGFSIEESQDRIDKSSKPFSMQLKTKALIKVSAVYKKDAETMNVVGKIEGTDPKLKDEYLVIGAHLDHVGSQAGLLFPGANDNASGSAGVIQLAEAFQKSELKPRRSILFVLFASEEQGLNGSKHFVDKWNKGYDKIIAMFNLDCIGYGDSIQIGNGKSSPDLWKVAEKIDEANSNLMVKNTWSGGGADATPFHEKGIPSLYFVSKYSYDHLHLPTDTPETLNPVLFESIAKLAYLTAWEVAGGKYIREEIIKEGK